jgi:beta-lactam-binding protein with PASTA domain
VVTSNISCTANFTLNVVATDITPSVVGLDQAAADLAIAGAGLTVGTVGTECRAAVAAGTVVSQSPLGGASVPAGSPVNIVVSSCPASVRVPNVVDKRIEGRFGAFSEIKRKGLVVGTVTYESSDTVKKNHVISESPAAHTTVAKGSAVNLVVSSGPAAVKVPEVVDRWVEGPSGAIAEIKRKGLVVGTVTYESSDTVKKNHVISESPAPGTLVNVGSTVNIVVSSGSR